VVWFRALPCFANFYFCEGLPAVALIYQVINAVLVVWRYFKLPTFTGSY